LEQQKISIRERKRHTDIESEQALSLSLSLSVKLTNTVVQMRNHGWSLPHVMTPFTAIRALPKPRRSTEDDVAQKKSRGVEVLL
jgi:hypothetical protein